MGSSVWRGYISFGLVSIPVRLFRAARPERVKLRDMYTVPDQTKSEAQEGSRIGPVPEVLTRLGPVLAERREAAPDLGEQPMAVAPIRRVAINEAGAQVLQSD